MNTDNRRKAIPRELAKARRALLEAEALAERGFIEGTYSRAYYAAFHGARAALLTKGLQPRTHKGVNERFNLDLVVPGLLEAGLLSVLGRLQTRQDQADYSLDAAPTMAEAIKELDAARHFVARIERFLFEGGWLTTD